MESLNEKMKGMMFPYHTMFEVLNELLVEGHAFDEDYIEDDDGYPQPDFPMELNTIGILRHHSINEMLKWVVDNMDNFNSNVAKQMLDKL